jgi:hypothetical protein
MPTWLAVIVVTSTLTGSVGFCSWVVVQIMGLKARVAAIEKTCRERQADRQETVEWIHRVEDKMDALRTDQETQHRRIGESLTAIKVHMGIDRGEDDHADTTAGD